MFAKIKNWFKMLISFFAGKKAQQSADETHTLQTDDSIEHQIANSEAVDSKSAVVDDSLRNGTF